MSLPRYYEVLQRDFVSKRASCPCGVRPARRMHSDPDDDELQRLDRVVSSDSATSSAENRSTERHSELPVQTLVGRSTQYERLVSGMESEVGEAPPAYESISAAPVFRSQRERFYH
jgi:hypothetical protein